MYGLPRSLSSVPDKYCIKCGKKLIKDKLLRYEGETGAPVYSRICPTKECGHNGINHVWLKKWHHLGKKCFKCDQYRSFYA